MSNEYRELVELLAKNKINATISNGFAEHAEALFEAMLKNSTKHIRIYSGNLASDFYSKGDLSELVKIFLQKNISALVQIILDDDSAKYNANHPIFSLTEASDNRLQIRCLFDSNINLNDGKHFFIGDESAYREEEKHPLSDRTEYKAKANFNDPEKAFELIKKFDLAFASLNTTCA